MGQILVIDDELKILDFLCQALECLGHEVAAAEDGDEGIKLIGNGRHYDLVITDIDMPRAGGREVAAHIRRSDRPDTPVLAITGRGHDMKGELFNYVLMKPFNLEDFKQAIEWVMQNH